MKGLLVKDFRFLLGQKASLLIAVGLGLYFLDTTFIVALFVSNDQWHPQAINIYKKIKSLYFNEKKLIYFYIIFFDFTEQTAGNPTVATMIFFAMLLTGFGLYRKLGQFAGAGSAVPVTGFGNAVISAAIEHKSEGFLATTIVRILRFACRMMHQPTIYMD